MSTHAENLEEIKKIYGKLLTLRDNTQKCTDKLSKTIKEDKWIDKNLLISLSSACHEMGEVQNSLFDTLRRFGVEKRETVSDTEHSVKAWDKKEKDQQVVEELKKVLNEVCCLTYDGESADIQADLVAIQKEAGTLLHDIEHYIKHQDRLNDFQQLLNWVKLSKPLSLEEVKQCQGKFGFNLMYAVVEHQLKLGGKPSTDVQIELSHVSMKDKKEEVRVSNTFDIPSGEFYDNSLQIKCVPPKSKMLKFASKFKSEYERYMQGMRTNGYQILRALIEDSVLIPDVYKVLFIKDDRSRELFSRTLPLLYQLGLIKEFTLYNRTAYILNTDFLQIYKADSIKRLIKYTTPISNEMVERLFEVTYVRNFINSLVMYYLNTVFNPSSIKMENMPQLGDCAKYIKMELGKETPCSIGLITPVFTHKNIEAEMTGIKELLNLLKIEKKSLIIAVSHESEKEYWKQKLASYDLGEVLYCNVSDDALLKEETAVWKKALAVSEKNIIQTDQKTKTVVEKEESKLPVIPRECESVSVEATAIKEVDNTDSAKKVDAKLTEQFAKAERAEKMATHKVSTVLQQPGTTEIIRDLANEENESTDAELISEISAQIAKHHMAEGMLMLHAMNMQKNKDWMKKLLSQVSYVLGDPLYSKVSFRESPYLYWNYTIDIPDVNNGIASDCLNAASMIRYFFKPSYENGNWHWQSNQAWKQISDDSSNTVLNDIPEIKRVISLFHEFLDKNQKGLGWCLGGKSKIQEVHMQELKSCRNALLAMQKRLENRKTKYNNYIRVMKTYDKICRDSDLYMYISNAEDCTINELWDFCQKFADQPMDQESALSDDGFSYAASPVKLDEYMDETWESIPVPRKQTDHFFGVARTSLKNLLKDAFETLGKYVLARCRVDYANGIEIDVSVIKKTMDEAEKLCSGLIGHLQVLHPSNPLEELAICSIRYLIKTLLKTFNSNYHPMEFYEPFLLTEYVELDEKYIPRVDFDFQIAGLSLYNRCLKHIACIETENSEPCKEAYEKVIEDMLKEKNMGFYKLLACKLGRDNVGVKEEEIVERGNKYLSRAKDDFRSELELAYNYGRLTQKNEIESYEKLAENLVHHLNETQNFGLFALFVDACKNRIEVDSKPRQEELEKRFEHIQNKLAVEIKENGETLSDYPILADIRKCLEKQNFSVAEDYMHMCLDGNLNEIKGLLRNGLTEFTQFVDSYQTYYNICDRNKRLSLDHALGEWFSSRNKSRTSMQKNAIGKAQISFVKEWDRLLSSTGKATPESFLEMLGYPKVLPADVTCQKQTNNRLVYHVTFKSEPTHQYSHPFKQFGSGIFDKGLNVITFTGAHSPENIMNELADAGIERAVGTICLLGASMPWADRCKLAELMKCSDTMFNVIVIDRVMALYLSQFEKLDRENKMMKLCMPFSNATPFQHKGFIPPEMFIGRTKELADIRDMDGPNLVYGGRQLGKSILLRQVSFLDNQPNNGHYAFYFDMKNKNHSSVLTDITQRLRKVKLLKRTVSDWDDFGNAMEDVLENVQQLILLIDEADAFILSANKIKDYPIEVLRMTQNKYPGRFKFVLAGLHNVIRFDRKTLSSNTVYGQLGHINIRPFEFADACDLLLKPLNYLGFESPEPEIVSTILAKTNYFPGLIQYYGKELLTSVKNAYRKHNFKSTNTPPYKLDEAYLKNLMEDDSFLQEIEDKFMITLRVDQDDDNYYYLITLGIAYLYAAEDKPVTLEKIKDVLGSTRIADLSDDKLSALLDELEELNVLRKVDKDEYIFNRYSFYSMLGGTEKIEKALSEYEEK